MAEELTRYAAARFGVVTVEQAKACGYDAREIEDLCGRSAWTRMRHGIYLPRPAPDPKDDPRARHLVDVAAAMLAIRGDVVAAHPLRGRALGLRVDRAARPGGGAARAAGRRAGQEPPRDHTVLSDCAGWPGIRRAARLLAHLDARGESVAESLARGRFLGMGLEEPEIQVEIRDARGHLLGRVDFYFRSRRLVIEIDGKGNYDEPGAIWKEKLREDRIREMDLEFLRLSWADLGGHPRALRARVDAAFARADRRLLTRSRHASLVSPGLRSSPGAGEGWGRRVRAGANE